MPFTPKGIEKAISQSQEKKLGEEGVLHHVSLNNKNYFAKQWRGKHYSGNDKRKISFAYEEVSDRSPTSPFWHKVKYYEYALIHSAFPESTLKISAGYDSRIKKNDNNHEFIFDKGRPVTLAKEVPGDSEARRKRDEIIDSFYEKYLSYFKPDEHGVLRSTNGLETRLLLFEVDYKMQEAFGRELYISKFDWSKPKESLQWLADEARRINPQSKMANFFESGLIPSHPEFNFIPTDESNSDGLQGVFIEMAIADIDSLRTKLVSSGQSPKKVDKKIERYMIYRTLDDIYDDLFVSQNFTGEESLRNDADIVNAVFQILNTLREHIDKQGLSDSEELIDQVYTNLYYTFEDHDNKDSLLHALRMIKTRLNN